ncbi:HNH endonuclease [Granulosicoccus antarcticus]|uniref:HNH nuclease domain-containing protein n=1 Tax=Granulosicoccus antarcticus IMCC3135 TaxID=1192854 RepID=A0A2Z2NGB7_9GAMM|nr:HNH endonuclease [Granulosicoccus antarcticus]ASJ70326.1 hypothetical protein IMCC3135_01010 [Granulosicoccus antarcticus IMCC3135]
MASELELLLDRVSTSELCFASAGSSFCIAGRCRGNADRYVLGYKESIYVGKWNTNYFRSVLDARHAAKVLTKNNNLSWGFTSSDGEEIVQRWLIELESASSKLQLCESVQNLSRAISQWPRQNHKAFVRAVNRWSAGSVKLHGNHEIKARSEVTFRIDGHWSDFKNQEMSENRKRSIIKKREILEKKSLFPNASEIVKRGQKHDKPVSLVFKSMYDEEYGHWLSEAMDDNGIILYSAVGDTQAQANKSLFDKYKLPLSNVMGSISAIVETEQSNNGDINNIESGVDAKKYSANEESLSREKYKVEINDDLVTRIYTNPSLITNEVLRDLWRDSAVLDSDELAAVFGLRRVRAGVDPVLQAIDKYIGLLVQDGYIDADAIDNDVSGIFTPSSYKHNVRSVVAREGQSEFRKLLLRKHGPWCELTHCKIIEILEAAHIFPYYGGETSDSNNGIVLRSDVHKLFDRHLIQLDSETLTFKVHKDLLDTEYAYIEGRMIARSELYAVKAFARKRELHFKNELGFLDNKRY